MARDLTVPNLVAGADAGHLGLIPIDSLQFRHQQPQTIAGVGRSFVDVAPRGGLAIINAAQRRQTTNFGQGMLTRGIATSIPVRTFDANTGSGDVHG